MKQNASNRVIWFGNKVRSAIEQAYGEGSEQESTELLRKAREQREYDHITIIDSVPRSLRLSAAVAWRFLLVMAAIAVVGYLVLEMWLIFVPVLLALLFTVMLEPLLRSFLFLRLPRALAAVLTLFIGLAIVTVLVSLASTQILAGMTDLWGQAQVGVGKAVRWLWDGPLHLDQQKVIEYWAQAQSELTDVARKYSGTLASGALSVTNSIGVMLTQFVVIVFCVFFFLKDGRIIWQWFVRMLPPNCRDDVNEAAIRGWVTLGSYARTQALVAAIDSVFIAGAAYFSGLPLWFPLGILVFLGGFIPYVGAFATGVVTVLVALVDQGSTSAIIMLVVVLAVQQIEGNILSPLLMSNAVDLHPIAVLLVVTAAGYEFGIIGAMFAVPIAAFVNTVVLYMYGHDKFLRLNYDKRRPGGPPGLLAQEIEESFRPTKHNVRTAIAARERWGESVNGTDEAIISADTAQKTGAIATENMQSDRLQQDRGTQSTSDSAVIATIPEADNEK